MGHAVKGGALAAPGAWSAGAGAGTGAGERAGLAPLGAALGVEFAIDHTPELSQWLSTHKRDAVDKEGRRSADAQGGGGTRVGFDLGLFAAGGDTRSERIGVQVEALRVSRIGLGAQPALAVEQRIVVGPVGALLAGAVGGLRRAQRLGGG